MAILRNILISLHLRDHGTLPSECAGTLFSLGYYLVQNISGCVIQDQNDEVFSTHPLLGPLLNNGGLTLTQALPAGSLAINRGDLGGCTNANGSPLLVDQRGVPRLGRCDIGAYEYMLRLFLPLIQR